MSVRGRFDHPLDVSALTDPIDETARRAYRADLPPAALPPRRDLLRAVALLGLALVMSTGFAVFALGSLPEDPRDRWGLVAYGVFFAVLVIAAGLFTLREWRRRDSTSSFRIALLAEANGLEHATGLTRVALPGLIFGARESQRGIDLVSGNGFRIGNLEVTTPVGKHKAVQMWGFAAIETGAQLPHILLDARGNNALLGTNLPVFIDHEQRLSLEGDFDKRFTLYAPREYERDALYLFTPDIMARFIDNASELDVEIVDGYLFLYSKRPLSTSDPETWTWLWATLAALSEKFDQWERWRDDRLGETVVRDVWWRRPEVIRPPQGVASGGRRLVRKTPWWAWVIAIAIGALVLWPFFLPLAEGFMRGFSR